MPRTWDTAALQWMQVPLADPRATPVQVSEDYYYRIPVQPVFKTYPVYLPGRAPAGYEDWLKQQEPRIVFDASKLKTKEDWIQAGQLVFDAPVAFGLYSAERLELRYFRYHNAWKLPAEADSTIPYFRFVIRKKGILEIGRQSCASCHTRVRPDGSTIKGAQGTMPNISLGYGDTTESARRFNLQLYATPWITPDPLASMAEMAVENFTALHEGIPPGVGARHGTSPLSPTQVPDLIGIKERRYLDHTGLLRHAGPADLMRYAALNQGMDNIASYGGFIPRGTPDPATLTRYSDEQLYALALYLYSLEPPQNPNKSDVLSARGQQVFRREGCGNCHTPPLYTNNKLTLATGFSPPNDERTATLEIIRLSVGTDPRLATATRRGTGYYKVPSLKGVWYRGPFEHQGSVKTLEDWFNPDRLKDDYVPTGFIGYGKKSRAVKGHEFGLKLSADDKAALIAFLKTL